MKYDAPTLEIIGSTTDLTLDQGSIIDDQGPN